MTERVSRTVKEQDGKKENNQRHCKMGIAFKIQVKKCKENSSNTIRFIASRVQHSKFMKIWYKHRSM